VTRQPRHQQHVSAIEEMSDKGPSQVVRREWSDPREARASFEAACELLHTNRINTGAIAHRGKHHARPTYYPQPCIDGRAGTSWQKDQFFAISFPHNSQRAAFDIVVGDRRIPYLHNPQTAAVEQRN